MSDLTNGSSWRILAVCCFRFTGQQPGWIEYECMLSLTSPCKSDYQGKLALHFFLKELDSLLILAAKDLSFATLHQYGQRPLENFLVHAMKFYAEVNHLQSNRLDSMATNLARLSYRHGSAHTVSARCSSARFPQPTAQGHKSVPMR